MRIKPIATILLMAFVLTAIAVILARRPQGTPAGTGEPGSAPVVVSNAPPAGTVDAAPPVAAQPEAAGRKTPPAADTAGDSVAEEPASPRTRPSPPSVAAGPETRAKKVVATYFHGSIRCATCRKVESYAREAVEEGFKSEVASGAVEFRAVNLEVEENAHFIHDYQLTNKSVVVTEEVDGIVVRWAKLDEVWSLVGDRDRYHVYVQDAVRGYLEP